MLDLIQWIASSMRAAGVWLWEFAFDWLMDNLWAAATAAFVLARMFGTVVETGWVGVLFTFGRVKSELPPGFHWQIPIIHRTRKVRVRSISLDLAPQRIVTCDELVFDVDANFVYHISEPIRAVVQIDNVHAGCRSIIPLVIASYLGKLSSNQLNDRSRLDEELGKLVQKRVAVWGVAVEHLGLRSISPTPETLRITQLSMRCETQAQIYHSLSREGLTSHQALALLGAPTRLVEKSVVRRRGYRRRPTVGRRWARPAVTKEPGFQIGDRVWANWWELGTYYPGVVLAVDREHVQIKYDDGDTESVHLRNVRRKKPKDANTG